MLIGQGEGAIAEVNVWRAHSDAQPHRLGHVDRRVVEAAGVRQSGAEELGRPVRAHVGRAVADIGVGGGVPLVKAVAGEGHDLFPEARRLLAAEAGAVGRGATAAVGKGGGQRLQFVGPEATDATPQPIGLCPTQSSDLDGDAQDLLLEQQNAAGAAENRLQRRMQVGHRLLAAIAGDEGASHAAHRRAGLEERPGDGQIAHRAGAQLAQRAPCAVGFALKDADGVAGAKDVAGGRVVGRDVLEVEGGLMVAANQFHSVGQHRQGADAQQVKLGQADSLYVTMLILCRQEPLGREQNGQRVGQWAGGDDQAAGVEAGMVGAADEAVGQPDNLALVNVGDGRQHVLNRLRGAAARVGVPAMGEDGDQGGERRVGQAVGLACLAHGRARLERVHRADQGHTVVAIGTADVVEHLVAPAAAKVQVDVGRAAARGAKEALEQQVVGHGINGGDAQAVGQQRVGDAAAGADRDVGPPRKAHQIGHQQEERRVAIVGNGRRLLRQPSGDGRGRGVTEAVGQPDGGGLGQLRGGGLTGQHRPEQAAVGQRLATVVGHFAGGGQKLRPVSVGRGQLMRRGPFERAGSVAAVGQRPRVDFAHKTVGVDGRQQP